MKKGCTQAEQIQMRKLSESGDSVEAIAAKFRQPEEYVKAVLDHLSKPAEESTEKEPPKPKKKKEAEETVENDDS